MSQTPEDDVTKENNTPSEISNVIKFPKKHTRPEILSEDLERRQKLARTVYAAEITSAFVDQAMQAFITNGVDINDPVHERDIAFFYLVVMGVFMRSLGLNHQIHTIVDSGVPATDEQGNIGYVWHTSNVANQTVNVNQEGVVVSNTAESSD